MHKMSDEGVHYEECEYQCACANDEWLASTHQLELAHQQIAALCKEVKQLTIECDELSIQCYRWMVMKRC